MGVGKWFSASNVIKHVPTQGVHVIREDEWGHCSGNRKLYYPGINSCCGFAIQLSDNTLVGAHFTILADAAEFQAILDAMNNRRADRGIAGMFFFGPLKLWTPARVNAPGYHWASMINFVSYRFGYTHWLSENIHYYDQIQAGKTDYRLLVHNGAARLGTAVHTYGRDYANPEAISWSAVQMLRRTGPWFGALRGS